MINNYLTGFVCACLAVFSLATKALDETAQQAYDEIVEIKSYVSKQSKKMQGADATYRKTWEVAGPKLDRWLDKYHGRIDLGQQAWLEWYAMIVRRRSEMDWVINDFERYLEKYQGKFPETFEQEGKTSEILLTRYILPKSLYQLSRAQDKARFDLYLKYYFSNPDTPYEMYQLFIMNVIDSKPGKGWNPGELKSEVLAVARNSETITDALYQGLASLEPTGDDGAKTSRQGYSFQPFSGPTLDGGTIAISDYKGKVLLVDFWATWCAPCMAEMPELVKLYDQYRSQGFEILGVAGDDSGEADTIRDTIADAGMGWTQLYDNGLKEAQKLNGVKGIPYTVLLDKNGAPRYFSLRASQLEEKLKKLFASSGGRPAQLLTAKIKSPTG